MEYKDYLELHVVTSPGIEETSDLTTRLAQAARDAIKFQLQVKSVTEKDLPSDSLPTRDECTGE